MKTSCASWGVAWLCAALLITGAGKAGAQCTQSTPATPVVLEALSQARVQAFSAGRASDTSNNANEFDPGLGTIAGLDPTSGTAKELSPFSSTGD